MKFIYSLFFNSNTEYLTLYNRRLLAIATHAADPSNALLQRCVPILEQSIRTMHQDLSARLTDQLNTQARTNDYITRLVTGQATISLNINLPPVNSNEQPTSSNIITTSIPSSSPSTNPSIPPADDSNNHGVPTYSMSRGIVSIPDLWREWYEGLCGNYSISELERRWGTQWRKSEKEKKFFNRRYAIIKEIERYAVERGISTQTAVEEAERNRMQQNCTLNWLSNNKDKIFG